MTSPQGKTWRVAPHIGTVIDAQETPNGLVDFPNQVEGGFETGLGWFGVKWSVKRSAAPRSGSGQGNIEEFVIDLDMPIGTEGVVGIPRSLTNGVTMTQRGRSAEVEIDGVVDLQAENGLGEISLSGGKHTIVVRPSS